MFNDKKKKNYSEVSDTNKNINSDYFNVFQNEFKKMFPNSIETNDIKINDIKINDNEANDIKVNDKESNDINFNNIELDNNDIVFINLFSKYIKNKQVLSIK